MTRAKTNKLYRTFVKGMITEAGFLTYPEDASYDELNTILSRKGNRSRRLGIDYEEGGELLDLDVSSGNVLTEYVWKSVNNDPLVSFACFQVGSIIHFFEMNDQPLSSQKKSFTVDLSLYKIPTAPMTSLATEYASFSAGQGVLFIAHRFCDPVSVEYKPNTDKITVVPLVIQIRDLEGVYDGLANDEEPKTLSPQHHYNLRNQGWLSPGSKTTDVSVPSYPGSVVTPTNPTPAVPSSPDEVYYDPYTGGSVPYWKSGSEFSNKDLTS